MAAVVVAREEQRKTKRDTESEVGVTDSLSSFVPRHDVSFLSLLYLLAPASHTHTTFYFLFSPSLRDNPPPPYERSQQPIYIALKRKKRERVNLQVDVFFPFSLHNTGGWQAAGHWDPADQSQLSRQHVQTRKGITNKRRRRRRLILSRLQVNGQVGPRERERDGPAPRL